MELREVTAMAAQAQSVVDLFEQENAGSLLGAEVHHIGATSLPFGQTKGDVDVNLRVRPDEFSAVVAELGERYDVAQLDNWADTFASFSTHRYALPFGIQVTVIGSSNDHLLALRDRMREDPELLRRYNQCKIEAAGLGPTGYWEAKNAFLQAVLV